MPFDHLKRRQFMTLLGGAAAAWPLAARAQQPAMPVIGFLSIASPGDAMRSRLAAFRKGLSDAGYVEDRNVSIEYRWAEGRFDRLTELASDLVGRRVSVIATPGNIAGTHAAKALTTTIPVVFGVAEDPVTLGLVASLSRPGGNLTGINFLNNEVTEKRLGLMRELIPGLARVAVLINPASGTNAETTLRDAQAAAGAMGLHMQVLNASTNSEINTAFASLGRERPDALIVGGDAVFNSRRVQLVNLASRHALPATYENRLFTEVGGLMSYGSDLTDMYRQVGAYIGRILKGAKPADLPVVQASKFDLVVNAETARMLGITIPASLLALADEVIE
jgi:putative tryptophan/tyrosine transport system substrate-binding protein